MRIICAAILVAICSVAADGDTIALADPPVVRKDFNSLPAAAVDSVRKGVAEMMKLDVGKADKDLSPIGWKYQAYIHGVPPAIKEDRRAWDTCQHSTWFFLSWHRMELYFFERILKAMSGDATLTLPYWNFSVPPAGMDPKMFGARLPAPFRVRPTMAAPNALWWPFRKTGINKAPGPGATDTATPLDHAVVATLAAFDKTAFFSNVEANGALTFGGGARATKKHLINGPGTGQLESIPHNQVHGAVGDDTPLSLSDADGAGLDPIFWPFHANIDRAWSCWQEKHPGTEPKSDIWLKTTMFAFFDVKKKDDGSLEAVAVTMTGQEVIDTAKQLGYKYDNNCQNFEFPPAPPKSSQEITTLSNPVEDASPGIPAVLSAIANPVLATEPVTLSIPVTTEIRTRIETLVKSGAPEGSIMLTVHEMAVDKGTGASYGIYLDLPEGVAPDRESEYYATELSFFGVGHHGHRHDHDNEPQEHSLSFDITKVVSGLVGANKLLADQITVTFANTSAARPDRAAPPPAPVESRARFSYLSLAVK